MAIQREGKESAQAEAVGRGLFAAEDGGDGDPGEGRPIEDALGGVGGPDGGEDEAVADDEFGEVAGARSDAHEDRVQGWRFASADLLLPDGRSHFPQCSRLVLRALSRLSGRYDGPMHSKVTGLVGTTVLCLFGLVLSALLLMYAASPWIDHNEIPFFGTRLRDTAIFSVLGSLNICILVGLARGKRWAWWFALFVAGLVLSMALFLVVASMHPRDDFARSEGGFGLFLSFCLLVPGAVSAVLLSLPAVRRRFWGPS